ncbi:MAG: sugar ABC transporter ATP-binding protein [Candidatus Brocadiae bacterium]|nr:sugar ABC transporter ATP-binding protein [Candidatus Brocadiia bacterium]
MKRFAGVRALDGVDFDVRAGEVHALIGENGAGKSTLMNVLAGRFPDYEGRIHLFGQEARLASPRQALALGVGVIYQELSVLPNLTVAENILLGHEPPGRVPGTLDRRTLVRQAQDVLDALGFRLPVGEPVGRLSHARQCLVEIAHAIRKNVRLLVFDEPTASLAGDDVERLFAVIRDLRARGIGIAYISHRLAELPQIADRVTVLRDGKAVGTRDIADVKVAELSHMMLGRRLTEMFPEKRNQPAEPILRVEGLSRPGVFEDISFTLRRGEILGIAGLVGSGRTEIARAIFGADRAAGRCALEGRPLARRSPRRCTARGIGMIQENRTLDGNVTGLSVERNIGIGVLDRLTAFGGVLPPRRVRRNAQRMIERMDVRPRDPARPIQTLSGGNQQKAILGRWLCRDPKVLILDEPTQGIDVGTKAQIYRLIMDLASDGRGIILISSEFFELVNLADRILVVRDGRLVGEMPGPGTEVDAVFAACVRKGA